MSEQVNEAARKVLRAWDERAGIDEASKAFEALRAALEERPKPPGYNLGQIAWELERTAMGDGYYGNALRVAKDIPGLTPAERSLLDHFLTGMQSGTERLALQDLAIKIYQMRGTP